MFFLGWGHLCINHFDYALFSTSITIAYLLDDRLIVDLVNDLMDEMIDDFIDQFIIVYRFDNRLIYRFWMDGKTLVRFIDRMLDRSID